MGEVSLSIRERRKYPQARRYRGGNACPPSGNFGIFRRGWPLAIWQCFIAYKSRNHAYKSRTPKFPTGIPGNFEEQRVNVFWLAKWRIFNYKLFNVNKVHSTLSESEYSRLLSNDDLWFLKLVIKTIFKILLKLLLSTAGATLCMWPGFCNTVACLGYFKVWTMLTANFIHHAYYR